MLLCNITEVLICLKQWIWLKDIGPSLGSKPSSRWCNLLQLIQKIACTWGPCQGQGALVKTLNALSHSVFICKTREQNLFFLPIMLVNEIIYKKITINFKVLRHLNHCLYEILLVWGGGNPGSISLWAGLVFFLLC